MHHDGNSNKEHFLILVKHIVIKALCLCVCVLDTMLYCLWAISCSDCSLFCVNLIGFDTSKLFSYDTQAFVLCDRLNGKRSCNRKIVIAQVKQELVLQTCRKIVKEHTTVVFIFNLEILAVKLHERRCDIVFTADTLCLDKVIVNLELTLMSSAELIVIVFQSFISSQPFSVRTDSTQVCNNFCVNLVELQNSVNRRISVNRYRNELFNFHIIASCDNLSTQDIIVFFTVLIVLISFHFLKYFSLLLCL